MAFPFTTFLAALAFLLAHARAATYVVGDATNWTVPPTPTTYSDWASRHTFRQGDSLVFNFLTGSHDVARVRKSSYDNCGSNNANLVTVGPATFHLNSTGPDFYICTFLGHCSAGQKLSINVIAAASPPTPPPATPPTRPPPTRTPTPAPTTTPSPPSTAPAPAPSTAQPPSPPPASAQPTMAPTPSGMPSGAPSPSTAPGSSASPVTPSPASGPGSGPGTATPPAADQGQAGSPGNSAQVVASTVGTWATVVGSIFYCLVI